MDGKERIIKRSSYDSDHIIAKLYCRWIIPFYNMCQYKQLEIEDLYKCSTEDESEEVVKRLEINWSNQLKTGRPNFAKAFIKTFAPSFIIPLILFTLEDCVMKTLQPILLGLLVRYFSDSSSDNFELSHACMICVGLCVTVLMVINLQHPAYMWNIRTAMRAKIAWSALIYKKSLQLNRSSIGKTTVGQIINLMTNDIRRFDEFSIVCSYLLIVPIQTIIFVLILWQYLGSACLATLTALLLFVPFLAMIGKKVTQIRTNCSQLTDIRICLMNEIIRGIRVIKMYGWEQHFSRLGHEARRNEMKEIKMASIIKAITLSVSFVSGRLVMFLSFVTYVLMGGKLSTEAIFVTIALFERLRYSMTWMFPQAVSGASEILVSCKRMQTFLLLEEIRCIDVKSKSISNYFNGISVHNLNSCFNSINTKSQKSANFSLKNISFDVRQGEILAVVGPVGSGKSSLLMSLLGELDSVRADSFLISGSISYVSQESYCFNATIRENILFGKAFNENLYRKIIFVCALEEDIKQLDFGDQTVVGERGVTLSGGQKARINLARALYQESKIYLLDDPLSAVDATVAKHIFDKCILEFMKDKAIILVTHRLQFITQTSNVIYLFGGKCQAMGNFNELNKSGIDFVSILKQHNNEKTAVKNSEINSFDMKMNFSDEKRSNDSKFENKIDERGVIDLKLYYNYFKSGSGFVLLIAAFLSTILTQFLFHFTDYWLTLWNRTESSDETMNILIYSIISISLFILATFRSITFYQICLNSSELFHNLVFDRLLSTSINVFHFMPIGTIFNRFTRDIGILDETLPSTLFDINLAFIQLTGILIMVVMISPYLILPALLFAVLLIRMRKSYVRPSQEMRKFEAITRSPIYSHVSTTFDGLTTIRAFGAQQMFLNQYYAYQNDHTSCWFLQTSTARAFGITLDYIGFIYIVVVIVTLLIFRAEISEKGVGLTFSSILTLTGMTQWAVKRTVDAEVFMTSVQRLDHYCNLPKEEESDDSYLTPDTNWPQNGDIEIRNVDMIYPNTQKLILNNINLKIKSGQKVGVVGRTGAGKTSLINALFRLCPTNGNVIIDGIDTKHIRLHDLRTKLSIIPQEPIAFSGSIRTNLDPFNQYSDQYLWSVLEEVELKKVVKRLPRKMETIVSENGFNLSVGQRQLICLARALLRRNRILILDEATAYVDYKTDSSIQNTIKNKFSNYTVITVAHRIDTVIDCDRILVMDCGRIVEDNSPYNLLKQKDSYFSKLVQQNGNIMANNLRESKLEKLISDNKSIDMSKTQNQTILRLNKRL